MKPSKVIITLIAILIFIIIFVVISTAKAASDIKTPFTILGLIIFGGFLGAMKAIWKNDD